MRTFFTILLFIIFSTTFGQSSNAYLYRGKIDGKISVTMYLKSEDNSCNTKLNYQGMYKYNSVSNWLQLDISQNEKDQFILTEYGFTGVLILQKTKDGFNGIWISPDTKKQLKVELKKEVLKEKDKEMYEEKFEKVNYENYDC
jgi:hypothetical protein